MKFEARTIEGGVRDLAKSAAAVRRLYRTGYCVVGESLYDTDKKRGTAMNTKGIVFLIALPASFGAAAQERSLKEQLVGSWEIVSDYNSGPNGEKRPVFGEHPHGVMVFAPDGHFALVASDSERPKWKGQTRAQVTPEEYKTTALGLFAQSGTWTVDEGAKTLNKHIEAALNPGNEGNDPKLPIRIDGDELQIIDPASAAAGGSAVETFRRLH